MWSAGTYNLDPASVCTYMAQPLDSPGLLKKAFIPHAWGFVTNKVAACFFNTPCKPISYTLHAQTLAGSRG